MPDSDLVQHSNLIVVAHVKPGSIVYIPHLADGAMGWKHTAVLILGEVIKGKCDLKELPVVFHYGMDPIAVGAKGDFQGLSKGKSDPNSQIMMGYQGGRYGRLPGDLRKDHIWFLSYPPKPIHPSDSHEDLDILGVSEPEELQPVELKPYFEAFLQAHPEDVLKLYASGDSPLAFRSQTYLNHLAILQILREPDVHKRARLLLPYFLFTNDKHVPADNGEAALQLWESCGQTGAAFLLPYFNDPKYEAMQTAIMSLWTNAQYHGCIPMLCELLEKETQFWQHQSQDDLNRWTDMGPTHGPTMPQILSRNRIEMILFVFRQVPDPRAQAEVDKLRPIWQKLYPGDGSRSMGQGLMSLF